jgi:hypothetical protein
MIPSTPQQVGSHFIGCSIEGAAVYGDDPVPSLEQTTPTSHTVWKNLPYLEKIIID